MANCLFGIERLPIEIILNGDEYVNYNGDLISCDKITDAIEEQVRFDYDIPDDEIIDDYVFWSWIDNCTEDQIIDFVDAMRNAEHSEKFN